MNELGRRLRQIRISSGMTQSEVGTQVGLSRSAVTQIESGNRDVTADELVRFSTILRHGPEALLSGLGHGSDASVGEMDGMLDDIVRALPGQGLDPDGLRAGLDCPIELSRHLTEVESVLGVTVYGPQASAFRGTSPRNHWEAAHQGYAVAEDERQRLDLGSAPIRDVPETLATLRVRIARLALPESVSCVYLHTPETGPLVIVNRNSSSEEGRFWMVHGLAHLLFEPERRWLVCSRDDLSRRHEVRANAFAGRFLMPTRGVERYLHSTGRDTMGSSLGGVLEVFSDRGRGSQGQIAGPGERPVPAWGSRVQRLRAVSGRRLLRGNSLPRGARAREPPFPLRQRAGSTDRHGERAGEQSCPELGQIAAGRAGTRCLRIPPAVAGNRGSASWCALGRPLRADYRVVGRGRRGAGAVARDRRVRHRGRS